MSQFWKVCYYKNRILWNKFCSFVTGININKTSIFCTGCTFSICHNPNSTLTRLKNWVGHKNDFTPPPTQTTTTTQTQCHQYITCSCPDFNQTLKLGFGINNNYNMNNNKNNNSYKNNKSNSPSITDPICAKLLMEGFLDKTTTKTTTSSLSSTKSTTTTEQKQLLQQIYLIYYWPNFDQTWNNNNNNRNYNKNYKNKKTHSTTKNNKNNKSQLLMTWIGPS